MIEATHEDAELLLHLYEMRREKVMRKARKFILGTYYASSGEEHIAKYPPGTDENAWFRQVLTYWDMVGALVKRGLLHSELLFETTGEFHIVWVKTRAAVLDLRKSRNMPTFLRHLEELALRHKEFMETNAPGSSEFYATLNQPPEGS